MIPRRQLQKEFFRVALVSGKRVCLPERSEMLEAIQLPNGSNIGAGLQSYWNAREVILRPAHSAEWIGLPVDSRTEVELAIV
jgi:hypothetical protein